MGPGITIVDWAATGTVCTSQVVGIIFTMESDIIELLRKTLPASDNQ
jgi:hypothetical protein